MSDPDDATIEAVARWLEAACPHAKAWQLRRMAERLRSGAWLDDLPKRSDQQILLGRVDDKIDRRIPPSAFTPAEHAVWTARNDRARASIAAQQRRTDKIIAAIEVYANAVPPPTTD